MRKNVLFIYWFPNVCSGISSQFVCVATNITWYSWTSVERYQQQQQKTRQSSLFFSLFLCLRFQCVGAEHTFWFGIFAFVALIFLFGTVRLPPSNAFGSSLAQLSTGFVDVCSCCHRKPLHRDIVSCTQNTCTLNTNLFMYSNDGSFFVLPQYWFRLFGQFGFGCIN